MHACMYGYVCEWAWSVVEQRKEVGECAPRPASWRRPPERWSTWSACTSRPRRTRRRTSLCPESAAAACSDVCESTSKNNLAPQRATQNYVTITSHDHANCSQANAHTWATSNTLNRKTIIAWTLVAKLWVAYLLSMLRQTGSGLFDLLIADYSYKCLD